MWIQKIRTYLLVSMHSILYVNISGRVWYIIWICFRKAFLDDVSVSSHNVWSQSHSTNSVATRTTQWHAHSDNSNNIYQDILEHEEYPAEKSLDWNQGVVTCQTSKQIFHHIKGKSGLFWCPFAGLHLIHTSICQLPAVYNYIPIQAVDIILYNVFKSLAFSHYIAGIQCIIITNRVTFLFPRFDRHSVVNTRV